jgi:hypothetical protein
MLPTLAPEQAEGGKVRSSLSFPAKRELLAQSASRYQVASRVQKSIILDEFIATTGYARKYAIRLLTHPVPPIAPIKRPRERRYGPVIQDALVLAWHAANDIGAKRLVPFLEQLVPNLERHGHLSLSDDDRAQLLAISPATVDRLLRPLRHGQGRRGMGTTRAGSLLKHQIPIRTFADWDDVRPGFFEVDLVAHCGTSAEGAFLQTLTMTDVATGWTECFPLLHRAEHTVIEALGRVDVLLPFSVFGLDTDNGRGFLNAELLAYCERQAITFTRGRVARKNDQCFVEQKNGSIVRQFVGYDRFEGEHAYYQLGEVYRALRLYVNFFQPSMKLKAKRRQGSSVHRSYDLAQTPYQRLIVAGVLDAAMRRKLDTIVHALDPVRLLRQIETLQDALWRHAIHGSPSSKPSLDSAPAVRFSPHGCGILTEGQPAGVAASDDLVNTSRSKRKYHRATKPRGPRTYRTRTDPFAEVWDEITQWLATHPEQTAKEALEELQQRYPGAYPTCHLRTLQRRVQEWRVRTIVIFNDEWFREDVLAGTTILPSLRLVPAGSTALA